MATDINLNQLIINKLKKAQYQEAKEAGQIVDTEIYIITDDENQYTIPEVTTSDNGKFLRVVDGTWAAATVPNAEEASF